MTARTLCEIVIVGGVSLLFAGCTTTRVQYVKAHCPRIAPLEPVDAIEVNVTDGCACGDSLRNIFEGIGTLRSHERYYRDQIEKYNGEFAK